MRLTACLRRSTICGLHAIARLSLRGGVDAPGSRDNLSTPSLTMQMADGRCSCLSTFIREVWALASTLS